MDLPDIAHSKLSAFITRQQGRRQSALPVAQLGKEGTSVASSLVPLARHAETVPVSAPFGFRAALRGVAL
jgi:hypothetical protein